MNTQQLLSFVRTAEELSFTKAAKKLYLSVPTISRNIKSLEGELNVRLLSRDRHGVVLTAAGRSFYEDARIILNAQEMARRHAQFSDKKQLLRIGCTSPEEFGRISSALEVFRHRMPDILPKILTVDYAEGLRLLEEGGLDLMLGSDNMAFENKKCRFWPFGKQSSLVLVPCKDPLADRGTVSFLDLKERVLLCIPDRMVPFCSLNAVKDFLTLHNKHVKDIECSDCAECIALVRAGYGVCLLPEYRIPDKTDGYVLLELEDSTSYTYGVLTGKKRPGAAATEFIDILKSQFR